MLKAVFNKDLKFAIVGAGRVGVSTGVLLKRAGHRIVGCSGRSGGSLERSVRYLDCPSSTDPAEAIEGADCILIAVPDDAVEGVVNAIVDVVVPETYVVHAAGSFGLEPLQPLAEQGAKTLAIHVLQSVPTVDAGIERIPGSWFGVSCDQELHPWAEAYVATLQGLTWWLGEKDRVRYHAAAVIASNYLVGLCLLIEEIGMEVEPYLPLIEGTLANIREMGAAAALTGPVVRGDAGTLLRHRIELEEKIPAAEQTYVALSESLVRAGIRSGRISPATAKSLREVLKNKSEG